MTDYINEIRSVDLLGYSIKDATNILKLRIAFDESFRFKEEAKPTLIIAVDVCADMINRLSSIQNALIELIKIVYSTHNIYLITFGGYKCTCHMINGEYTVTYVDDPELHVYNFTGKTIKEVEDTIKAIDLGTQTSYKIAFDAIRKIVEESIPKPELTDLSVLFITGSEDNTSHHIQKEGKGISLNYMINILAGYSIKTTFHIIGISEKHDAMFIGRIPSLFPGSTYQYVKNCYEIMNNILNVVPLFYKRFVSCEIKLGGNIYHINIPFKYDEVKNNIRWQENHIFIPSSVDITSELSSEATITFKSSSRSQESQTSCKIIELSKEDQSKYMNEYLNHVIVESMDILSRNDLTEADFDKMEKRFYFTDSSYDIDDRVLEYFCDVFMAIHKNKKDNDKTARMYDVIYKLEFEKNNIKTKLSNSKEKEEIVPTLIPDPVAPVKQHVKEHVKEQKIKEQVNDNTDMLELLAKTYQDINEEFRVYEENADILEKIVDRLIIYGDMDPMKLMKKGDCACICVNMSMKSPNNIKIKTIIPAIMGANVFKQQCMKAVEKANNVIKYIDSPTGQPMNAVIPLFLFDDHYEFSKIWLLKLYEQYGMTYEQIINIPFLLLSKAMYDYLDKNNEHTKIIVKLAIETCKNVYDDNKKEINKKLMETLNLFMTDPIGRTVKSIPSNELFLSQLVVAQEFKYIEKFSENDAIKFARQIVEEEVRRSLKNAKDISIPANMMFEILQVNRTLWVDNYVKKYESAKEKSIQDLMLIAKDIKLRMLSRLEKDTPQPTNQTSESSSDLSKETTNESSSNDLTSNTLDEYADPSIWEPKFDKLKGIGKSIVDRMVNDYVKYGLSSLILLKHITDSNQDDLTGDFSLIGITSNEQHLAYALQNFMHAKDTKRYEAMKNGTYYDVYNHGEAVKYLKRIFIEYVNNERTRMIKLVDDKYSVKTNNVNAKIFAIAEDPVTSAGCLYGVRIGVDIMNYASVLMEHKCPLAREKIIMLLTGEFRGIRLYSDSNSKNICWKPSKKNARRLWSMNEEIMDFGEWLALFNSIKCDHNLKEWQKDKYSKDGLVSRSSIPKYRQECHAYQSVYI